MAKFEPGLYRKFRIAYPLEVFVPLKPFCKAPLDGRLKVLDLGAGTGLSARSFLDFYPEANLTLVEPDKSMLIEAELDLGGRAKFYGNSAENFRAEVGFDIAIIGSAWHWMQASGVLETLFEVLKPGGALLVFEYQFPKANGPEASELNEWVRREFNLRWRPQRQTPRGSLAEITEPLRASVDFSQWKAFSLEQDAVLLFDTFLGVIFSQSRYLAYEDQLPDAAKAEYRSAVRDELSKIWGENAGKSFRYSFDVLLFRRRNP